MATGKNLMTSNKTIQSVSLSKSELGAIARLAIEIYIKQEDPSDAIGKTLFAGLNVAKSFCKKEDQPTGGLSAWIGDDRSHEATLKAMLEVSSMAPLKRKLAAIISGAVTAEAKNDSAYELLEFYRNHAGIPTIAPKEALRILNSYIAG